MHVWLSVECWREWDGDRSRRTVAKRRMWALCVVVDAPVLDDHLGLPEAVEDLAIEAFIPELAIEGLAVAVLLG